MAKDPILKLKSLPRPLARLCLALTLAYSAPAISAPVTRSPTAAPDVQAADRNPLTFVQITDAHLFDAGKNGPTEADSLKEQQDNRDALHWAVLQINRLVDTGTEVNFVVFTGDLGLYLVRSLVETPCNITEDEDYQEIKRRGWPKLLSPKQAANELATQLSGLKVGVLYLVPGNNDLTGEDPCDLERYRDILKQTASEISGKGPRLVDLTNLSPDMSPQYGQYRLLGLNSASFKKPDDYKKSCQSEQNGCPRYELDKIQHALDSHEASLYLLFTHVPDLKDPYALKNQKKLCDPPTYASEESPYDAWCGFAERPLWNSIAGHSNLAAIFAGHFHDADRLLYATRADETPLAVSRDVAAKTWVAPPLALKNQETRPITARGFVLIRIRRQASGSGVAVSVTPFWYTGTHGCGAILLWVLALAAILLTGFFVWRRYAHRPPSSRDAQAPE